MEPVTLVKLWLLVRPIRKVRYALAVRRSMRKGTDLYAELPEDLEENNVFPKGTMTKSGSAIAMLGPVIGVGLAMFGVGATCPVDLPDCVPAGEMANTLSTSVGGLITVIGGIIAWRGRNRVGKI